MYLRSMRREVYAIARDCNIPIIVVWVNTPLELALQRNSQRSGKQHIEEQTIIKIHTALEPPDAQHICDRVHVIIDGAYEDRYSFHFYFHIWYCLIFSPIFIVHTHSINRGIETILSQAPKQWQKRKQEAHLQRRISQASAESSVENNDSLLKELDASLRNVKNTILRALY